MHAQISRLTAALCALGAFFIAVITGLNAGNEALSILLRAVAAMVVCYFIGLILGTIWQRAVERHAFERMNRARFPAASLSNPPDAARSVQQNQPPHGSAATSKTQDTHNALAA